MLPQPGRNRKKKILMRTIKYDARDRFLSPVAAHPEIAARTVRPISGDPDCARPRRHGPITRSPVVPDAAPAMVAGHPRVSRTGPCDDHFAIWPWRAESHVHTGRIRRRNH